MENIVLRITPKEEKKPVLVYHLPLKERDKKEISKKLLRFLKNRGIRVKGGRIELEVALESVLMTRKMFPDEEEIEIAFNPFQLVFSTVKLA